MEAADALQSMQEQYHDLVELQKSIIELHQMFVEVAVLIEAQGEMMDQIEVCDPPPLLPNLSLSLSLSLTLCFKSPHPDSWVFGAMNTSFWIGK